MTTEIRPLTETDLPRSWYLGSNAFRGGSKDLSWRDNPNRHTRREWGLFEGDEMQARLALIPFTVQMGPDVQLPMGGIAGVVGAPAARGKGYARKLVVESLGWMRDAGQCVSFLFPFSHAFYRELGWEWVGENRIYKVDARELPKSRQADSVREARESDRQAIIDCYTRFSHDYRGMVVRTEKHWNLVWEDGKEKFTYRYVYEHDGDVEGYLFHTGTKAKKVWVEEFICTTQRARFGLLGLLKRHDMQTEQFEWEAPGDDGLWFADFHWKYRTKVEPKCQARVTDLKAVLDSIQPIGAPNGRVVISVADPQADWNDGVWRIETESGTVQATRCTDSPDVSLTIGALSQACFGTPNLTAIRRYCGAKVHNEAGFTQLQAVLAGGPMWCNEHF